MAVSTNTGEFLSGKIVGDVRRNSRPLHMHTVPHWEEEHHLVPVPGGMWVIPEKLKTTYNLFRPDFEI